MCIKLGEGINSHRPGEKMLKIENLLSYVLLLVQNLLLGLLRFQQKTVSEFHHPHMQCPHMHYWWSAFMLLYRACSLFHRYGWRSDTFIANGLHFAVFMYRVYETRMPSPPPSIWLVVWALSDLAGETLFVYVWTRSNYTIATLLIGSQMCFPADLEDQLVHWLEGWLAGFLIWLMSLAFVQCPCELLSLPLPQPAHHPISISISTRTGPVFPN